VAGADPDSLLAHVVYSLEKTAVRDVCVAGQLVLRDGRHPLEEEIVREFGEVQRKLWR
jgi:formimidoylglutamate deiminase